MAARPNIHHVSNTNTPLQNRYTNEDEGVEKRLPSGRCNFTNLSVGGNAPICGCRRFWWNQNAGFGARSEVCMCEHHACYHDDGPEQSSGDATAVGTPRLASTPQIPLRQSLVNRVRDENSLEGRTRDENIPDTLQWGQYVRSGSSLGLPAIPSQCLLPSENGSTTSGSQARYMHPFGGQGLQTLSHIPKPSVNPGIPENLKMQVHEDANGNRFLQSLTEIATPSVRASQDASADSEFGKHIASVQDALEKFAQSKSSQKAVALLPESKDGASTPIKQSGSNDSVKLPYESNEGGYLIPRLRNIVNNLADYPTKIQNHEQRLDHLENASFSNAAIEELQDVDDRMDTRVGELEERLVELEKQHAAMNDTSSVGSRQLIDASFSSRISNTSSAMIASAIDRVDVSRVEALEAQVAELQASALPSHSRPWEVEVVFLPFGSRLMGIWSSQYGMSQRSRLNSSATNDWTQTQHNSMAAAQACLTAHDQASDWERFAIDRTQNEDDTTWLMARACGMRSRVDERLRSRGLVKLIRIFGPDARDVQAAIMTAFGDLPDVLTEDPYSQHDDENIGTIPTKLKNFLGLSAPWIPLRKLHKDSCLRFLTPSELATPALWTVPFLSSSVAMRHTGVRRLYVTHRDSYIQHLGPQPSDWTWAKLRQLPRVYPNQPSFTETPEADADEPCWAFDERLDPTNESIHSSFESHISGLSIRSMPHAQEEADYEPQSHSDHFSSAPISPHTSATPTSIAAPNRDFQSSPLKERNPFRPIHTRTTSMPVPLKLSNSQQQKRRIASFEHEPEPSPTRPLTSAHTLSLNLTANVKRRRTRSPSRPRDTVRYSVGPPSPFTNTNAGYDDVKGMEKERGTTPFAYATPHSNAPYVDHGSRSVVEVYEDQSEQGYEEGRGSATDDAFGSADPEENAFSVRDDDASSNEDINEEFQERQVEDEWEGVQEIDNRFEAKAINVAQQYRENDEESDASESPSEYPSTRRFGAADVKKIAAARESAGFRIHVDDEGEDCL